MTNPFDNKVAVVTGGASGLGRGLCEGLAARGALVVVADLDLTEAEKTAEEIRAGGGRAEAVEMNVTDDAAVDRGVAEVVCRHGSIDYMFNNAGIGVGGQFHDVDATSWRRIVDVNLLGTVWGSRAAYRHMLDQGSGHIVNIASMWGLLPGPVQSAYTATKHAVVGMSQALRIEAADLGVKVTTVCPGYIRTNLFRSSVVHAASFDPNRVEEAVPFDFIDVEEAVDAILRGIERNDAIVAFPRYVRVIWAVLRHWPGLYRRFSRRQLSDYRTSLKTESDAVL